MHIFEKAPGQSDSQVGWTCKVLGTTGKKEMLKQDYVLQSGAAKDTSWSSMSEQWCFKCFDECCWWTGEV